MSSSAGVRQKISDYLAERIDAIDLEDWISTEIWDAPPSEERQLGDDALRLLAEASNGEWTDNELRLQLARLCGLAPYGQLSVSGETSSVVSEGFLEKLSEAEENKAQSPKGDEARLAAMMRYARFGSPTVGSSETAPPSDRGFLDQPTDENKTPSQVPKELAAS